MVIGDTTLSVYLTPKQNDRSDWNSGDLPHRSKVCSTQSNATQFPNFLQLCFVPKEFR